MLKQIVEYLFSHQGNRRKSNGKSSLFRSSKGRRATSWESQKSTDRSGSTICGLPFSRANGPSISRSSWCVWWLKLVGNGLWFLGGSMGQGTSTTSKTNSTSSINYTIKVIGLKVKMILRLMIVSCHICLPSRPKNQLASRNYPSTNPTRSLSMLKFKRRALTSKACPSKSKRWFVLKKKTPIRINIYITLPKRTAHTLRQTSPQNISSKKKRSLVFSTITLKNDDIFIVMLIWSRNVDVVRYFLK